ncbi:MAG: serine protease [Polyangiaceae bacterium]
MRRALSLALPFALTVALSAGCAEPEGVQASTAADAKMARPAAGPSSGAAAINAAAPGHLARADVERVLRQGPPWLLRRVVPEEVIREGKFFGWRVLSMPDDWKIDLKNGDIVTKVNGLGLERPDDLWSAWMQLQSAVELRVSIERDGKSRDVVLPIDGATTAGASLEKELEATPPPKTSPSRWSTKVIESDEPPPPPPADE